MKKLIGCLVGLIVVAIGINFLMPSVRGTADLPFINYTSALEQSEEEYLVYFYQETCTFCKQLEPQVIKTYSEGTSIYVVDMLDETNQSAWYDWTTHHEKYTKEIGEVINGERVLYEGESYDKYAAATYNITEREGKIVVIDNEAKNNLNPTTVDEIEISGTPSILRIKNGKIESFASGLIQSQGTLDLYSKTNNDIQ